METKDQSRRVQRVMDLGVPDTKSKQPYLPSQVGPAPTPHAPAVQLRLHPGCFLIGVAALGCFVGYNLWNT